jgi:cellulose synthase/poly-beta-1,6-N-acetylglucosamine synthase-like glycosyltransferase
MRTLLVACDDIGRLAPLDSLVATVRQSGECWTRVLDTVWYVRTSAPLDEVVERFVEALGDDDGLVIQSVSEEPVLINTMRRWFRGERDDAAGPSVPGFLALAAA